MISGGEKNQSSKVSLLSREKSFLENERSQSRIQAGEPTACQLGHKIEPREGERRKQGSVGPNLIRLLRITGANGQRQAGQRTNAASNTLKTRDRTKPQVPHREFPPLPCCASNTDV